MKLLDAIKKSIISFQEVMNGGTDNGFEGVVYPKNLDPYLCHAWVNIAVNILTRNIARAKFVIQRNGDDVNSGRLYELFRRPNDEMSGFDLWKETAAWWCLEGEAFWWFGADYSGGIPGNIYILDPRRMRHETIHGLSACNGISNKCRWFYETESGSVPVLSDELVHFRDWNPWNAARGVNPLVSLALELEQDYYANKANSELLKHNAIPHGILKTEQTVRPEEADALERRWESKFGAAKSNRKIAVLGKGTSFEAMSFTPEVVKLFELKRWNLYTILAKYGIPPRVANINDRTSALSGKDTAEQHSAFWKYTIVPLLKQFENIIEGQFFLRLRLNENGVFDLRDIPELQESEDAQSGRDIAEINAGLKTINDVLRERGKETKSWGDIWYRPNNLIPV
ncbi:MAG: phage portal protein [Spirochaetaceae bacterium]|jgi:HK97 family phage portal protein|nr:phage portal protein [Spirochaetaceae bacterium]